MANKLLLNQVVALVTGKKPQYQKDLAMFTRTLKQELADGLIRSYVPFNDEDKNIPSNDSKGIAVDLRNTINDFGTLFAETIDLVATNDVGNQSAVADIQVPGVSGDDVCLLRKVPVTHLLYLEKMLSDLRTFIVACPVLNPMQKWSFDETRDCYATAPVQSTRTAKRKQKFVKAEATDRFPAQVDVYDEDVPVGTWNTTYISTALDVPTKKDYIKRIDALIVAVKKAREVANSTQVEMIHYGRDIIDYVFGND